MQSDPSSPQVSGDVVDPEPLSIEISCSGRDFVVVTPVGEADCCTVPGLRQALEEVSGSGRSHVVVDLARLAFMDASCLGVLVEMRSRLAATGSTLQVRCRTELGRRMLSLTGLDDMLDDRT
jgi:anti-anti-sigma factor